MASKRDNPEGMDPIVYEARQNLMDAMTETQLWRGEALEDLNFRIGDQWPLKTRQERELAGQPCLSFNLVPKFVRQVTGDARQNKPAIDVHPVNSEADVETADILKGAIRGIEYESKSSIVYQTGLEQCVLTGMGYWRVKTDYVDDDTFDQKITLDTIENQFSVYWDPLSKNIDKSDAQWCIVRDWYNKDVFKRMYPNEEGSSDALDSTDGDSNWNTVEAIAVAEYWVKEPTKRTLEVLSYPTVDGQMKEMVKFKDAPGTPTGAQVTKTREVNTYKLKCHKITGNRVIETSDWAGKYIPIVAVPGELVVVEGKRYYHGIVRFMKDPQRFWNYWLTMMTEQVALAPKSPWVVTASMIEEFKDEWDNANNANYPYLRYSPDPEAAGAKPERQGPPQLGAGYVQLLQIGQQGLNDTSGIFKPGLGEPSNETSGRAILARQREGDQGTYVYIDNWLMAIEHTGRIILDLFPYIYDTERVLMILDEQGKQDMVPINQLSSVEGVAKLYDVRKGKYDARIATGPSYATRRIETANSMLEFIRIVPNAAPLIGDLIAKNMDWPDAEEIAKRLEQLTQPPPQGPPPGGPGGDMGQSSVIMQGAPVGAPGSPVI